MKQKLTKQLKYFNNKQSKQLTTVNTSLFKKSKIQPKKQNPNQKYKILRELSSYHFFHKYKQKKHQYLILPDVKPFWLKLIKNSEYYRNGKLLPLAAAKLYNLTQHTGADRQAFAVFQKHKHNINMFKYNVIKIQFKKTPVLTDENVVHINLNFNPLYANKLTYYPWFTTVKNNNGKRNIFKITNPMTDEIYLINTLKIARIYLHIINPVDLKKNNQIGSLRFTNELLINNKFKHTYNKLYNFFYKRNKGARSFWRALKHIEWWPYEYAYFEAKRLYAVQCEKRYGRRAIEAAKNPQPIKTFNRKFNKHGKKKNWIEYKRKQSSSKARSYRLERWVSRHVKRRHQKKFGLYYAQDKFIRSNFIPTYKMFIRSIKTFMFANLRINKFISKYKRFSKHDPFLGQRYISIERHAYMKLYVKRLVNISSRCVKHVNKTKRHLKITKLKITHKATRRTKRVYKNKYAISKFRAGYIRSKLATKNRLKLSLKNTAIIKKLQLKRLYVRDPSQKPVTAKKQKFINSKSIYNILAKNLDLWNTHYIHLYDIKSNYLANKNSTYWDYKLGNFPLNRAQDPVIKNGLLTISRGFNDMNYEKFIAEQNEQRLKPRLTKALKRFKQKVKSKQVRKLTYAKWLRVLLNKEVVKELSKSRVEFVQRLALNKLTQSKSQHNKRQLIKAGKYKSTIVLNSFIAKKYSWLSHGDKLLNSYTQSHNREIKLANYIQFRAFRWKYYVKRWYSKISRWKRLAIFRRLMRTAWRNYRKLKKNFIFIKLFRANLSHIMGISEPELLNKWIKVRRGDSVNTTQPIVTRFNQSLQLKMDGMAMFIGLAPNRPLAQELVKFGGMRINGLVLTDINHSMALNDILQVDLKVNRYIRSLYKDTHWGSVRKRIRYSRFLQVTWPLMLFTMVRYPHSYELLEESILNERWVRFFIRYFPIRISKYKKAKVKWYKY